MGTRRARCAGTCEPPRSSVPGWTSSASRRRMLTRRWSLGSRPARRPSSTLPSGRLSDVAYGVRDRASVDPRGSGTSCPGRRAMRVRAVAAALRRSSRASAWPGRRYPADVPALRRSRSCRVRGDADARLVPSHRTDDRGVRAGPGQRALSVVRPQSGHGPPCVSSLPARPRRCSGCWPRWTSRAPTAVVTAIVLLLSRLGLRAAEAAALTVKDVDWHNGIVRVAGLAVSGESAGTWSSSPRYRRIGSAVDRCFGELWRGTQ